ncbi:MAG: alpha-E domain-containing protein [Phascolarctobacterium sp.]|nr:alpha-E domain-containing protein [Phascolarctobacterium sp.]
MGIISLENTDRLYWLGRYAERVYTTTRLYFITYDSMIDNLGKDYKDYCESLEIPDIYKDEEDFINRYSFDEKDPNSIMSNLNRAYGNAIMLREEVGTECIAYIQLAMYEMEKAKKSDAPLLFFQRVEDNIMAFFGICDDMIANENARNIIKVGKRVERIDLFARTHETKTNILREVRRLEARIKRTNLKYNEGVFKNLYSLLDEEKLNYHEMVEQVEKILEV